MIRSILFYLRASFLLLRHFITCTGSELNESQRKAESHHFRIISDNHFAYINQKHPSLTRFAAILPQSRCTLDNYRCSGWSQAHVFAIMSLRSQPFRTRAVGDLQNGFARGGDRWPILIMASVCRFNEPPPTTAILVAPRTRWRWPNDETTPHSATWLIPTRNLRCPQLPEWREALPPLFLLLLPLPP